MRYVGEAIHRAQNTPLNIRHDVLIERRVIGRLLGKGGRDLEAMQLCSGAEIFIIDKYPPPGEGDDHRLCVLIGKPESIRIAIDKVGAVLARWEGARPAEIVSALSSSLASSLPFLLPASTALTPGAPLFALHR